MQKVFEMQKWNISANRTKVIKILKNGSFYVLSAEYSKKSVGLWARYLSEYERYYLALLGNAMDYWVPCYF